MKQHKFLIEDTCYFHHEWERCAVCGRLDRPDDPELKFHSHHDEDLERVRMEKHPEHPAHIAMREGRPVEWVLGTGWVVKK